MSPIWGAEVNRAEPFEADLDDLRGAYPDIETVVEEFEETLRLGYGLPHFPITRYQGVYVRRLDYPPMGSAGRGRFRVIYHATEPEPSMSDPYRTFTLLALSEA